MIYEEIKLSYERYTSLHNKYPKRLLITSEQFRQLCKQTHVSYMLNQTYQVNNMTVVINDSGPHLAG